VVQLNKTDIAAPLGVSVPTVTQWLAILEITGQILLVPPYYESFGKRVVKTPKLYFVDSGLGCHLLGVHDVESLARSPFLGPLFESLVASEIAKARLNRGKDRGLYYFRDRQGLEVDFVVELGNRRLALVEAKATRTPTHRDAESLIRLAAAVGASRCSLHLIHQNEDAGPAPGTLRPGVTARCWRDVGAALG
jgi:uncharacterized protein